MGHPAPATIRRDRDPACRLSAFSYHSGESAAHIFVGQAHRLPYDGKRSACPTTGLLHSDALAKTSGHCRDGWVAQLVEQRTENPRVGGSIPSPATSMLG